ncbi:hypothetical protein PGIGA_G00222700 [Pangasianodon gigas]|uniref:Uncharacterized protein n=1 Tax=Pangasianodon gigas TaxID=30993 RepID=A0ACC5WJ27_PANGG|nr:hypothetical protein [Pangasianodon gigas]
MAQQQRPGLCHSARPAKCYCGDRVLVEGGKSRGGGLCVYINDAWCRDAVVVCRHCSPLAEFMIIKCHPFYLPREYKAILLVAVCIPTSSSNNNRSEALNELYQHINEQQTAHPDAFLILAGDFNHADLKSVFPKIYQHIDFPTRGNNILDFVYTTQRGAYKALPLPHLGASDHITVMLMPAYKPLVKVAKPVRKQILVWPEGSSEALQDCFSTTDWNMFKQAATYNNTTDLQEYTETVTAYITKCIDDVTVTKTITVWANQKPWLTGEVYRLLKARNAAFRSGDEVGLRTARSRGIREAKRQYSRRIVHRFSDSRDTRSLWRGIQTITDYKPPPQTCDSTISLLNELNAFFAHFEAQKSTTAQKTPPPPGDQVMTLSTHSVRRSLSRINARKAPGPDNIPGCVLRDCAVELTDVFTDIFNISLSQAVVPTCFKATTIIPVPKKSPPSCFNDYRPVALTPILMKCFERLVMHHIKSFLPRSLDPFQFAYRSNRSTDDAIATALHSALTHLDKKDSYIVQHELLHALGFNHEQCRSDRDNHIRVVWDNVVDDNKHNFNIKQTLNQGTPYDYNSVMQYPKTAFSKNGLATMIPIPDPNVVFGKATQMSQNDINRLKLLYQCCEYFLRSRSF